MQLNDAGLFIYVGYMHLNTRNQEYKTSLADISGIIQDG